MKERILFECVGQAGGNIGQMLIDKGYICHFINTSNDDLNSISVRDEFKYHVPNAMGCNKDRKKAICYAKDYHEHITSIIETRFPRQDIVFFVFSLGGGTGSGLSPIIIDYLAHRSPLKCYGAIVVLPSPSEPLKAQINALEAYAQLTKIEGLKSVFVLDNSTNDKFDINLQFVEMFDRLMNISVPDFRGVIDGAELETLLTCKGNIVMGYTDQDNMFSFTNSIFAPFRKGCQYIAISQNDEFNPIIMEKTFGIPADMFIGYNDTDNFVVCSGLSMYTKRMDEIAVKANTKQSDREQIEDEVYINVPLVNKPKQPSKKNTDTSFSDLFNKYME